MGVDTMRDRFGDVISDLLDTDPRVAVVMAAIGVARLAETGAMSRHPDRVVDVGIREQLMIGVAGGMALAGLRPFAHSYTPFLIERPFEQIKLDLAHQGVGAVLVSIGGSYDAAPEGRTHQSTADVALIGALPDWEVHVPGHPDELEVLLRDAAAHDAGVYLRLSSAANAAAQPITPGRFHTIRRGHRATVIAVGPMLDPVLEATRGLDASVLYTATARPFDHAALSAAESADVVLVEPYLEGTSAHEVASALQHRPHRLLSIGVPNTEHRRYGGREQHAADHGLDAPGIRRRIDGFLESTRFHPARGCRQLVAI